MKIIKIYYDDECPFCKEYIKYIELKKKYDIQMFNARDYLAEIQYFRDKGFDINDGMILDIDNNIYQGDNAIIEIDKLLNNNLFIDRVRSIFTNIPYLLYILYPIIKWFRFVVLKIMGKESNINKKDLT